MEVHSALVPGLVERLYEEAMAQELRLRGIPFERQVPVRLSYKGASIGDQVMDLVVGGIVIVELKSVREVADLHLAQLLSQLRSSKVPLGLLINFDVTRLREGIFRRVCSRETPLPEAFAAPDLSPHAPRSSSAASAFSEGLG
jgi:GxxExxY protein